MPQQMSRMPFLGSLMPDFNLPDCDGATCDSSRFKDRPVLVAFICNHCPSVNHIIDSFSEKAKDYEALGVDVVAISANDIARHPEDGPKQMKEFSQKHDLTIPYLYDESQDVAIAFKATCTPEFFLYDRSHRLVYRGQYDESRPGNNVPVTGADLTSAVNDIVAGYTVRVRQKPAVGCSIAWKPENALVATARGVAARRISSIKSLQGSF